MYGPLPEYFIKRTVYLPLINMFCCDAQAEVAYAFN
jgi:hypothetical protein